MTGYEVVDYAGLLALRITYCRTQIDRLEEAGDFPKSFKLSKSKSSRGGRRVRLIPLTQAHLYVVGAPRGTGRRVCEDCLA